MTELIRRYEIGGPIARGGMAQILAACAVSEPGVSKRVALKTIRPDRNCDPDFLARFYDEARLAMQLSHANIVQVFDFGRAEEELFLAMEFVEGVDLGRLLQVGPGQPLPPAEALHVVAQMLRGLDYAHRRCDARGQPLAVVHLDVKPANVLLSFEGEVKLTDFGVARSRATQRQCETPSVCGTVLYMSPEQARAESVDARSDVFSAGIVLYQLVLGRHPFEKADADAVRCGRCELASPLACELSGVEELLRRALAPLPEQRFPSAGAFADALEELMFRLGLRAGAGALARRLREAFPGERERLDALFAPGARNDQLAVARPGSDRDGTLLSRVSAPAPLERQTQVAAPRRRARRHGPWVAGAAASVLLASLGFSVALHRRAPSESPPTAAQTIEASAPETPRELSAAATVAPGQPAAARAQLAATAASPRAAAPPAERGVGTLSVNANPWGKVFVNGKLVGTTPVLRLPVPAGLSTVVVENPKLGRRSAEVRIRPRQETALVVELRGEPAGGVDSAP